VPPTFYKGKLNHFSKSSQLEKTFLLKKLNKITLGSKKFKRDHSSERLFYKGVPFRRIL
jgi:hypothetical protein